MFGNNDINNLAARLESLAPESREFPESIEFRKMSKSKSRYRFFDQGDVFGTLAVVDPGHDVYLLK